MDVLVSGDVHAWHRLGVRSSDRALGEQTAINQQLSAAKADGVQFWPLGFGTDIGNVDGTNTTEASALNYLNAMADRAVRFIHAGLEQESRRLL